MLARGRRREAVGQVCRHTGLSHLSWGRDLGRGASGGQPGGQCGGVGGQQVWLGLEPPPPQGHEAPMGLVRPGPPVLPGGSASFPGGGACCSLGLCSSWGDRGPVPPAGCDVNTLPCRWEQGTPSWPDTLDPRCSCSRKPGLGPRCRIVSLASLFYPQATCGPGSRSLLQMAHWRPPLGAASWREGARAGGQGPGLAPSPPWLCSCFCPVGLLPPMRGRRHNTRSWGGPPGQGSCGSCGLALDD